jgi:hypothetical protein
MAISMADIELLPQGVFEPFDALFQSIQHKEYQLAARIQLGEVNEGRGDGSRL